MMVFYEIDQNSFDFFLRCLRSNIRNHFSALLHLCLVCLLLVLSSVYFLVSCELSVTSDYFYHFVFSKEEKNKKTDILVYNI